MGEKSEYRGISILLDPGLKRLLAERVGREEDVDKVLGDALGDIAKMVKHFVWARQYSFADRLANAASRETISATLYEMLRISRSAQDAGRTLDENIKPYVASEDSVRLLFLLLDLDLAVGLDAARRVACLAMGYGGRGGVEAKAGGGVEEGGSEQPG